MDSRSISQKVVSEWAQALASGDEQLQIETLRKISNEDSVSGLAKEVVGLAGSQSDEVRVWAAEAMETAVQPEQTDLPQLIKLMEQSPDGEVCYWATTMLGRLGEGAASATSTLEDCLVNSTYLAARERAVWALSQIGPTAYAALPALKKVATREEHPRLKRLATKVVRRLTEESEMFSRRRGA